MDTNVYAILKDNYSADNNNKPLLINSDIEITFNTNSDSRSFSPDRFSIVFRLINKPSPFITATALLQFKDVLVAWKTALGPTIVNYDVEASFRWRPFH